MKLIVLTAFSIILVSCGNNPSLPVKSLLSEQQASTPAATPGDSTKKKPAKKKADDADKKPRECSIYRDSASGKPGPGLGGNCDCYQNKSAYWIRENNIWKSINKDQFEKQCNGKDIIIDPPTKPEPTDDEHVVDVKFKDAYLHVTMKNGKVFKEKLPKWCDKDTKIKEFKFDEETRVLTIIEEDKNGVQGTTWPVVIPDNYAKDLRFDPKSNILTVDRGSELAPLTTDLSDLNNLYDISLDGNKLSLLDKKTGDIVNAVTLPDTSKADGNDFLASTSYDSASGVLTFTMNNGKVWTETITDIHASDLSLDGDNILTITRNGADPLTQDLSGLNNLYDISLEGTTLNLLDKKTGEVVNSVELPVGSGADGNDYLASTSYEPASGVLTFTMSNGKTWTETITDIHASDMSLDENNVLVITRNGADPLTQDLSDLNNLYDISLEGTTLNLLDKKTGEVVNSVELPVGSGADGNDFLSSTSYDPTSGVLEFTMSNGKVWTETITDIHATDVILDENNVLTITRNGADPLSQDLSDLNNLYDISLEGTTLNLLDKKTGEVVNSVELPVASGADGNDFLTSTSYDAETGILEFTMSNGKKWTETITDIHATDVNLDENNVLTITRNGADPLSQDLSDLNNLYDISLEGTTLNLLDKKTGEVINSVELPVASGADGNDYLASTSYDPETGILEFTMSNGTKWTEFVRAPEKSYGIGSPIDNNFPGTEKDIYLENLEDGTACREWKHNGSEWEHKTTFAACKAVVIVEPAVVECSLQLTKRTVAPDLQYPYFPGKYDNGANVEETEMWFSSFTRAKYAKNIQLYFGFEFFGEGCETLKSDLENGAAQITSAQLTLNLKKHQDDDTNSTEIVAMLNEGIEAYAGYPYGEDINKRGRKYSVARNDTGFFNKVVSKSNVFCHDFKLCDKSINYGKDYLMPSTAYDLGALLGYTKAGISLTEVFTTAVSSDGLHMVVADDVDFESDPVLEIKYTRN